MDSSDLAIEMRGVRKAFGKKVAVEGIDLAIPQGSLHGFIGPNGAGKSTTIRMIMSILFPDRGELSVLGKKSAVESKDRIGYLPEERGVYKKMKVGAFLQHMGRLKGMDGGASLKRKVDDWLEKIELPDVSKKKCEELSKGMQQKVQFVSCVLHEPDLVILDEPFSGLDPVNMRLLRDLIDEQNKLGRTVIFSTHVMSQAEQICDHVVMIHNGQKVMDDPISAIKGRYEPRAVWFEPMDQQADLGPVESLGFVDSINKVDGVWQASLSAGDNQGAVASIAAAMPMARIELHRPSLEDVFIEMVTADAPIGADEEQLRASLRAGAVSESEVSS